MYYQPRYDEWRRTPAASEAGGGRLGRLTPQDSHRGSSSPPGPGPVSRIKSTIHRTLSRASLRRIHLHESHDRASNSADRLTLARRPSLPIAPSAPPSPDTITTPQATTNTREVSRTARENYISHAAEDEDDPWAGRAVLALDGGGIGGLASLFVLRQLMEEVAKIEKNEDHGSSWPYTEYRPHHYFDLIGGTSAGGLIAIMLGRLRMTVEEALAEYKKLCDSVSISKVHKWLKPYRQADLEARRLGEAIRKAFEKMLPEQSSVDEQDKLFRSDSMRCKTVVCSMFVNPSVGSAEPVLFRSYPMPFDIDVRENHITKNADSAGSYKIWEVARATSAAPIYFRPYSSAEEKYVDPAPFLYNPSWEVYKECTMPLEASSRHIDLFLSIGSEATHHIAKMGQRSKLRLDVISKMLQKAATVQKCVDVVDEAMRESNFSDSWYRRLNIETENSEGESFEESIEKGVQRPEVKQVVEECAFILVRMRKRRESTMLWEQFAEGVRYVCPLSPDHQTEYFQTRVELKDHLQVAHGMLSDSEHREDMQKRLNEGRRVGSVRSGQSSPMRQASN